ncbi:MAG: helix-turn-helix domain-containing protein [Ktedonobacteraceae bacterium]|nr:helix-turn-helix domain-containing protein [Ktedonobacteraceae bacterium]
MTPNRRLKQARELRGWSQARLAEMIGTDATTVSRWERGLFVPTPHFREKLCECFGKNAEELGLLDTPTTEPHLQGVMGLPREPDMFEGSMLSGPTSLPGRGEMVALKPRTMPEGVDTFTYILQRSSQEQQAYMLWEHAYVQALQDQPAEAQRLGQASVSVFEQVRHPNAAVVRSWLSQQGLLAAASGSADSARASEIARKRSSRPWLRVGGASVFVMLALVAGMMLSGVVSNRTQSPVPSSIKYSPRVVGGSNPSDVPTPQATPSAVPPQSHTIPAVANGHTAQTPTPVPTTFVSPTPTTQTNSIISPGNTPDPAFTPSVDPSQLNPRTCAKDSGAYRCEIHIGVYSTAYTTFSWQVSASGLATKFNTLSGTLGAGKTFQDVVYIYSACSQKGTLSFVFTTASSTHTNTVSVSWGC